MGSFRDLSNKKFGRLTALYRVYPEDKKGTWWFCKCDCGNTVVVSSGGLIRGDNRTCKNCLDKKVIPKRLMNIFTGMRKRCYNTNRQGYKNYGGRGIKICDDWLANRQSFYDWALNNGYKDNLTIDRIDNNGNYSPDNCRWISREEQGYNKTTTHYLTYGGVRKSLIEWAKELNIDYDVFRSRVKLGWSMERIISTPVRRD